MAKPSRKRATQVQKQEYLLAVHYYLDRGYETTPIVQALMRQFGFEDDRQPKRYIADAKAERAFGISSQTKLALLGDALFKADFLYRQAMQQEVPDFKLAETALSLKCQIIKQLPNGGNTNDNDADTPTTDALGTALERVLGTIDPPSAERDTKPE